MFIAVNRQSRLLLKPLNLFGKAHIIGIYWFISSEDRDAQMGYISVWEGATKWAHAACSKGCTKTHRPRECKKLGGQ